MKVSLQYKLVLWLIKMLKSLSFYKKEKHRTKSIRRYDLRKPWAFLTRGCVLEQTLLGDLPCVYIKPRKYSSNKVIFYLHGGAYISGPIIFHWMMLSRICRLSGYSAIMLDYPLTPESNCKNTLQKTLAAYAELASDVGPENIILMGDSAGGGLSLSLCQELSPNKQQILPSKLILLAPWLDVSMSNPDIVRYEDLDIMLGISGLIESGRAYACDLDVKDPRVSPLFGDLMGLPPVTLFIGTRDLLYPDCLLLQEKCTAQNEQIDLRVYEDMFHVWMAVTFLPEAKQTIRDIVSVI